MTTPDETQAAILRAERAELRIIQLEASSKTRLSGIQFIVLVTFWPLVMAFIILGGRMVWSASQDPEVLNNLDGLLAAIAIFANPVSAGFGFILGAFNDEIKATLKGGGSGDS